MQDVVITKLFEDLIINEIDRSYKFWSGIFTCIMDKFPNKFFNSSRLGDIINKDDNIFKSVVIHTLLKAMANDNLVICIQLPMGQKKKYYYISNKTNIPEQFLEISLKKHLERRRKRVSNDNILMYSHKTRMLWNEEVTNISDTKGSIITSRTTYSGIHHDLLLYIKNKIDGELWKDFVDNSVIYSEETNKKGYTWKDKLEISVKLLDSGSKLKEIKSLCEKNNLNAIIHLK